MSTALIIDDSKADRQLIASLLQKNGLSVVLAESGEDGLNQISSRKPDIIILDVVLPGRSGFEICREIKSGDHTKDIPVILYSTKGTDVDKFWGMKQGANAYIPKPVDQAELLQTVQKLVT